MKQFLKIYLWQIISLLTGFATMFVVTPFLASNQVQFGIYTFVISLNLFLSYANFGFLSAGMKFASEAFARSDRREEQEIIGFVFFIMCAAFLVFGLVVLGLFFYPDSVLKGLKGEANISLARDLFLVFLLSLPVLVAHRGIQMIFNIRLKDYLYQRVYSIFNLLKIASVFYFFRDGEYQIVQYYAFTQLLTLLSVLVGVMTAKIEFSYSFLPLFKAVKYNPEVYKKTKGLAYNSLFVTISWILYYELDSIVIGKFIGLREVAVFNICLSIMTFSRSLYGILYNPFTAKFNHFIGRDEHVNFKAAFYKILVLGVPLSVIPTAVILLTMRSFILSWVGVDYEAAIPIITVMFASYFVTFLSNPTSIAMVALQNIRDLYVISAILPLLYWLGVIITYNYFGLLSFGVFKLVAAIISAAFYFHYAKKMFTISWLDFFKRNILPALATVIGLSILSAAFNDFLPQSKGRLEFLQLSFGIFAYSLIGMILYYFLSKDFQKVLNGLLLNLFSKSGIKYGK